VSNSLTALSLLLCLTTVVLWVRSYVAHDALLFGRDRAYWIMPQRGVLHFGSHERFIAPSGWTPRDIGTVGRLSSFSTHWYARFVQNDTKMGTHWTWGRFGIAREVSANFTYPLLGLDSVSRTHRLQIPLWSFALSLMVPPMIKAKRHITARRRAALSRCMRCGYDLRATPARCPECGTEPMQNAE
jgi:hypothetical protein